MNIEKKQWIAPQATEIEVNNGTQMGIDEVYSASDGDS